MSTFRPMRACAVTTLDQLKFPLYASPKYDGIRAVWVPGHGLLSNNLKSIPNVQLQAAFSLSIPHPAPLDMELLALEAPFSFQAATSAAMTSEGPMPILASLFDCLTEAPFESRYEELKRHVSSLTKRNRSPILTVQLAPQRLVHGSTELLAYEDELLAQGFEGVMLRSPDSKYKYGRSTMREAALLKLKRFTDAEARVLGVYEQMHNANEATRNAAGKIERSSARAGKVGKGVAGGLHVVDIHTGVEFDVGTGFTDAQRAEIYAAPEKFIGKIVKYKYLSVGVKEKPRHPTFLGFRHINDIAR